MSLLVFVLPELLLYISAAISDCWVYKKLISYYALTDVKLRDSFTVANLFKVHKFDYWLVDKL